MQFMEGCKSTKHTEQVVFIPTLVRSLSAVSSDHGRCDSFETLQTEMMVRLGFVIDCVRTSCFQTWDIVTQANDGEKIIYNAADRLTTERVSSPKEL